jgi:NAD(P)-dependent dehydrogenase (short-subunit alcohol dehydrogenase family)
MPTILITGANRGLGLEFARQYAADGWRVLAACREPKSATALAALPGAIDVFALEVTDFSSIESLAAELKGTPIDVLLNNAGQFGPRLLKSGERGQAFGHIDYDEWMRILRVNTFAPVKMAEAFIAHVVASGQKKIVAITSTMGSIASTEGGYYIYRTSKAALNMAMASLAKDVAARGVAVAVYCPGWVKTDMGGSMADIEPEVSIAGLRGRIGELSLAASGIFRRYDGDAIPW